MLLASSLALFVACGQDTGSTSTSTSGSASGTGGAPNCEGVYFVDGDTDGGEPCDICLLKYCCASAAECRDKPCIDCVNYLQASCGPKPRAVNDCLYTYCQPICSPGWPPTGATSTTGG
jgi:hypothetical protein